MSTPRPCGAQALGDALSNASSAAWTAPAAAVEVARAARQVDCRWLLALYAVIPLSLAIIAIDVLLLEQAWLNSYLPSSPTNWAFWTVVFGLPHIVASLLTMADREYVAHYRHSLTRPLLIFACISVLGLAGPQPVSYQLLFGFVALYTAYHVLSQQLGLTLMMMNTAPSRVFKAWKWIALAAGVAIYLAVVREVGLGKVWLGSIHLSMYLDEFMAYVAGVLSAILVVLGVYVHRQSRTRIGRWYMWANVAMLGSIFWVNELGYTLFVVLIPRIIHDVTAFSVYITHDANRNRTEPRNAVYRAARFTRLPPIVLLPLLSIAIAYGLTVNEHYAPAAFVIFTITFLHYYFEGFIWRGPNPHRQNCSFRKEW
jgi:hypothetical protein